MYDVWYVLGCVFIVCLNYLNTHLTREVFQLIIVPTYFKQLSKVVCDILYHNCA